MRSDCGINETVVSDDDLRKMFAAVDSDGSRTMDAEEFQAFIESNALAQVRQTPMLSFLISGLRRFVVKTRPCGMNIDAVLWTV